MPLLKGEPRGASRGDSREDIEESEAQETSHERARTTSAAALQVRIEEAETPRHLAAMFCLGLINNSSFVIMVASAKSLIPDAVGLVYIFSSIPSFLLRLSAPYWFDRVTYRTRVICMVALMPVAYSAVAFAKGTTWLQLMGILAMSFQTGLGEVSALALSSRFSNRTLTMWSSGTGLAGLFGYLWVVSLNLWLGMDISLVLFLANVLTGAFFLACINLSPPPPVTRPEPEDLRSFASTAGSPRTPRSPLTPRSPWSTPAGASDPEKMQGFEFQEDETSFVLSFIMDQGDGEVVRTELSVKERMELTGTLWPWMVPLAVVYLAEYAMQSGVWGAIGFPTDSKSARNIFYSYGNWFYQGGVFVSRSSGTFYEATTRELWYMPVLQVLLLVFFVADAQFHWWYDYSLLGLCFVAGLAGGVTYVNGYRLIQESVEPYLKELAMAGGAIASDLGTLTGEAIGIGIQAWLYQVNSISD